MKNSNENPQKTADLIKFTEKVLNGKIHFCTVSAMGKSYKQSNPKLQNCIKLHHHIINLEALQQSQEKCYCTCEIIY